jgi:putative heme-binding domain-containing protein
MSMRGLALLTLTILSARASLSAQIAAPDLAHGRAIFESQCARCHGIDGSGGMGANLRRPTLRRAPNDSALAALIQSGIPEKGMPDAWQISAREATLVAAYVRTLGRAAAEPPLTGDASRGRTLFTGKGACTSCHMAHGEGGSLGPDLSEVGLARSSSYIRRALIEPGADLPAGAPPGYAMGGEYTKWLPVRATTADGRSVTGLRVNEDAFTLQLRDASNRLVSLDKATLRSLEKLHGTSLMPSYARTFTASELDDVIAYLASLKGTP